MLFSVYRVGLCWRIDRPSTIRCDDRIISKRVCLLYLWKLRVWVIVHHVGHLSLIILPLVPSITIICIISINGVRSMRLIRINWIRCVLQRYHHLLLLLLLLREAGVLFRVHSCHWFTRFCTLVLWVGQTRNKWVIWWHRALNDILEYRQKVPLVINQS